MEDRSKISQFRQFPRSGNPFDLFSGQASPQRLKRESSPSRYSSSTSSTSHFIPIPSTIRSAGIASIISVCTQVLWVGHANQRADLDARASLQHLTSLTSYVAGFLRRLDLAFRA